MIKCKLNKKTEVARYDVKGDVKTLSAEILGVIMQVYESAPIVDKLVFKSTILAGLKEGGPVWGKSSDTTKKIL